VPRYVVEKHTDEAVWAFRVRDLDTDETFGFGLLLPHAAELAHELNSA
jgi:hypothetical protein